MRLFGSSGNLVRGFEAGGWVRGSLDPGMPNQLFSHYSLLLDLKKPWKVLSVDLQVEHSRVEIQVDHGGSKTCCPLCAKACPVRDYGPQRQWRHLDTMNFETIIKCRIPRSNCDDCGIKTVAAPWADKHSRSTLMFEVFAIEVLQAARSLDAGRQLLGLSWDSANTIIKRAVDRGLAMRDDTEVSRACVGCGAGAHGEGLPSTPGEGAAHRLESLQGGGGCDGYVALFSHGHRRFAGERRHRL